MTRIIFPLKQGQQGAAVIDLHLALAALIERGVILPEDMQGRAKLAASLNRDREGQRFGASTRKVVSAFQTERGIEPSGEIDAATANAINALIGGQERAASAFGAPLQQGASGDDVLLAHEILTGLGLHVADHEREARRYGRSTAAAVTAWRKQRGLPRGDALDANVLDQLADEGLDLPRIVRGIVSLADGTPVPDVLVVAIDRDFRAEEKLGECYTDANGAYRIGYTAATFARAEKGLADIGIKIFADDGKTLLKAPRSQDLVMNAGYDTAIQVTVDMPEGALASEFERLVRAIGGLVGEVPVAEIADKPGSDEGDFLARETGFDEARTAHVVVAHRLADMTGIRADYFYALLREDGLYGITPDRPRAVQVPVGFHTDTRAVLFEAVLLDAEIARAAIGRAVRKNIVSPSVRKEAKGIGESLQKWRKEALEFVSKEVPRTIIGVIERLIDAGKAEQMAAALTSLDPSDAPGLFDRLDAKDAFDHKDRDKARVRLELGAMLGFNLGLVEAVAENVGATSSDDVRALARLERKDWSDLIARGDRRIDGDGKTVASAIARRQASIIVRRFEKAFPTTALAAQLGRNKSSALPDHKKVAELLDAHPGLNLRENRLVPFFKQSGIDPSTIDPAVLQSTEKLQRVFQLTGNYRKTEALIGAGYTASADIVDAGRTQFIADAAKTAGIGEVEAANIYRTAENTNIAAINVATALGTLSWPAALAGKSALTYSKHIEKIVADQPDLKSLFGSTDTCECEHCRSIYGPAAYFADVMRFLRSRLVRDQAAPLAPSTKAAKDVLFGRRPDLGEIDLNCDNALIEVPHIDIVCELAEETVSPDPGFVFAGSIVNGAATPALLAAVRGAGYEITDGAIVYGPYAPGRFILRDKTITVAVDGPGPNWMLRRLRQTHGSAEERAAAPEYVNAAAYVALTGGKAAFGLPFDLFHAETRACLAAAGIDRAELMEALATGGNPAIETIAAEALGLSDGERKLIFAPDVAGQPKIWAVTGATAAAKMARLDVFTDRTGLDYRGVERLLTGSYVHGGIDLFIRHLDSSCDLAQKEIANLSDVVLDRMHRLLRLARKTGLSPRDVDRLANGARLGAGDLGGAALHSFADLTRLSEELNVGIGQLITWLDRIPIDGERSEHGRLFQNPTVTGALAPSLSAAAIAKNDADEAVLAGTAPRLSTVAADVGIAFGIRQGDLDLLANRIADAAVLGPNPPLTSTALAALYGRIGLARSLGLTAANLVGLERLAHVDPLAGTKQLRDFVATARSVEQSGFTIPDLAYLLERSAPDLALRDIADSAITPVIQNLRARIIAAAAENKSNFDASLAPGEQIAALEALLGRQPQLSDGTTAALADLIRSNAPDAAMGTAAKAVVDADATLAEGGGLLGVIDGAATKTAIDALVAAPGDPQRLAVLKLLMDGLADTAIERASRGIADDLLAQLLRLSADQAGAILRGARLLVGGARIPLIELLTTGDIVAPAITPSPAATPTLYRGVRLACSVGALILKFEPSAETLSFMFASGAALGWLELDATPFETAVPPIPPVPLAKFLKLADAFALLAEYPAVRLPGQLDTTVDAPQVLLLAAGGGAKAPFLDALAILTGWPRALLGEADTRLAFLLAAYRMPETWRAAGRLVAMLKTLAVPIAQAVALAAPSLGDAERRNARQMLRARYAEADWLPALKAIMEPIREAKRDALVAYLMANNPNLTSKADLYDHFLTDTEWSAKMPSSRLVHAHGTLQLFIQRCIAGLEPKATADLDGDRDWQWWDWMKNYRVWEVNRKVFVEAQYYIRPEWRDDKTEPFAEMEGRLLQNEINAENIDTAFEGYLDRLDEIAFLDVLATCYDFDREDLHVFGCTKGGEPRSYFHRVLQRERVWTAWTKIDLDIAGEHLIAFFRNKRLYLAWATFMEKGDDQQEATFPEPGVGNQPLPPAERWSEISLAVSEYTGKKWLPRRVSEGVVVTPTNTISLDQKRIFLTVTPASERFTVDVCLNNDGLRTIGRFLLTGCKGYPEAEAGSGSVIVLPVFDDTELRGQRSVEQNPRNDDALAIFTGLGGSFETLFGRTPSVFRVSYPFQASEIDRLLSMIFNIAMGNFSSDRRAVKIFGTLMPFFFEDNLRGYVLIPGFYGKIDPNTGIRETQKTFSNVRRLLVDVIALVVEYLGLWVAAPNAAAKQAVLDALAADPDLAAILDEIESYRDTKPGVVVRNFYHPLACRLRERFFEGGIPKLLARETQLEVGTFLFEHAATGYAPAPIIVPPHPRVELEFGRDSAYAAYNWELTFHAPHMIASKLMEAERFDEAETWLRYIFNPLGSSNHPAPQRYWNTKPFFQRGAADYADQLISAIMDRLGKDPNGAVETELADAVLEWRRNPFKPYLVARSRTVVFQQAIVDLTARVFLGRGDQYFRRDTLEDLVMASLDYSRVERLLGPRPKLVPHAVPVPPETYNQLAAKLDLFGNALRKIENLLPDLSVLPHDGAELPPLPLSLESLYFCIPPSEKLFELWDTLEERQANLRNSRTIDGIERSLSIFAPPLSVEELIKASAAGLSISAILAGMSAPKPPYKFRTMLRHAIELADIASGFSRQMEQAIASGDGEGLSQLKIANEVRYLDQQTVMLREEIKVAGGTLASLKKGRQLHLETEQFYGGRPYMNPWEIAGTATAGVSLGIQAVMAIGYIAAGGLSLIPKFMVGAAGFGGSPTANAQTGGDQISQAARDAMVGALSATAGALDKATGLLDKQASYLTRQEDWGHAAKTAAREKERADIEIVIAGIRETIAKEQLRLHGIRQQQTAAEQAYLKAKFTNRELFDWMAQQMRGLSRQMFNLAFEAAKAAERCHNFELGLTDSFIRSGQWNDNRRGLLAAENLITDLRRLESGHLTRNVREREMTKQLSLARLDPIALIELRTTGRCIVQLPEAIFDLDHPGHYFRRIKALSVTVPCVAGPYSSVPVKLTQTSNRVRVTTALVAGAATDADAYAEDPAGDTRFKYNVGSIQTIETSRGEDDAGLFALDLGDERYLPFEGSGLCGTYAIELPPTLRPFDYATISDLVLHLRYTARDGGGGFRTITANGVRERLNVMALKTGRTGLFQAFDLKRDRPDIWHRLVTTGASELTITAADLPYFTSSRAIAVTIARILVKVKGAPTSYAVTIGGLATTLNPAPEEGLAGLLSSSVPPVALDVPLVIAVPLPSLIEEMSVLVNYTMMP
ncbi:MAG: Tc toxin subunit A-related protein [Allorhizobium sp.]